MSIILIITTSYDKNYIETGMEIDEEEWEDFVESQDNLRYMTNSHIVTNPNTGAEIKVNSLTSETELFVNNEWIPFLYYENGELRMKYYDRMGDINDPIRKVISGIASYFGAIIRHDAGDEILDW